MISLVNIVTVIGLTTEQSSSDFQQEQEIVLCSSASRIALGPTQSCVQSLPGQKLPSREADCPPHSVPSVKKKLQTLKQRAELQPWRGSDKTVGEITYI
jgi:hypothetical protein